MGFKSKIGNYFLNKSGSYRFYKEQYEKHSKNNDPDIEKEFQKLKREFESFKLGTDDKIDSANFLFKTLYLDYELNEPKNVLKYIQSLSYELLIFVENVCKKYDIQWWLDYGNLLGAVRHGNYVPWDDDMDIGMMRKDYLEFDKLILKEVQNYGLGDIVRVEYKPREIDGKTIDSFIQLFVKDKTNNSGGKDTILGGVDVFPYDYMKEYNRKTINKTFNNAKINFFRNISKNDDADFCLNEYYNELNLNLEEDKFIIPGAEGSAGGKDNLYKLFVLKSEEVFPLKEIKFNDRVFPCPNNSDRYLRTIYGKYCDIPNPLRRHLRVDWYRYNTNNDEVFGKCLSRLQEVNSKFE